MPTTTAALPSDSCDYYDTDYDHDNDGDVCDDDDDDNDDEDDDDDNGYRYYDYDCHQMYGCLYHSDHGSQCNYYGYCYDCSYYYYVSFNDCYDYD